MAETDAAAEKAEKDEIASVASKVLTARNEFLVQVKSDRDGALNRLENAVRSAQEIASRWSATHERLFPERAVELEQLCRAVADVGRARACLAHAVVPGWTRDMERLLVIEDHSSADSRPWIMDAATGATRALPRSAPTRFAAVRWVEKGAALMGLSDAGADMSA